MKKRCIAALLAVVLLTVLAVGCGKKEESPVVHGKTVAELMGSEKALSYGGVSYGLRENVTSCLLMCVDGSGTGQAEILFLLVADGDRKTCTLLQLDPDTVCTVDILDEDNGVVGSELMRLGLSCTCGDGGEASCENTVHAVSRLLLETPVDGYAAIQTDAIPLLTDAIGGETLTPAEGFSPDDPEEFQNWLRAMGESIQGHGEDISFFASLYETVKDYVQSDLSVTALYKMLTAAMGCESVGTVAPEGTAAVEDGQNEFYPDEDALAQIVLSLFYEERPADE